MSKLLDAMQDRALKAETSVAQLEQDRRTALLRIDEAIEIMEARKKRLCLHALGQGLHVEDCEISIALLEGVRAALSKE